MVIWNTLASNCTVLIKSLQKLRYALNVSVKKQFLSFYYRSNVLLWSYFLSKNTLKGATNENKFNHKIGAKTRVQTYQLSKNCSGVITPGPSLLGKGNPFPKPSLDIHPPTIPGSDTGLSRFTFLDTPLQGEVFVQA